MSEERRAEDPRIAQILQHLQGQEKLFDAKLSPINELLKEHHRTLFGNGTEQGLRVDVDRLKQTEKVRVWYLRGIIGSFLVSAGHSIWKMVHWGK